MTGLTRRFFLAGAACSGLAACDLPGAAGVPSQVMAGAGADDATFSVYPVTRATLPALSKWPLSSGQATNGWIGRSRGASTQIVEAGDKIDLTVWDNSENSLLTGPGQKVVALQGVTVSSTGTVFLPYLDEVYIAKMTPDDAREMIQEKISAIVPAAQVQLTHTSGRRNSVDLVKGVARPGSYPLIDRDVTALSLISQAGGVSDGMNNPQVRLMRGGKLYGVSVAKLLSDPSMDTTLRGGDKLFVAPDDRYFLSLGAAGNQAQVPFPSDTVTALDAASLMGGVNAARGNPKGVLILREYRPRDLRSDGSGPPKDRVVFTVDLTNADGLFSAGAFLLQPKDLLLVTESPIRSAQTVLGLIGSVVGITDNVNNF